jgi:hypothetical protein
MSLFRGGIGAHLFLGLQNRRDNIGIGGAPAKIAAHIFTDRSGRTGLPCLHTSDPGHNLPRCAVATLQGIQVDKSLLHRVQSAIFPQEPFDSGDHTALRRHRQSQTREGAAAIKMHRAGAALAVIATLFRAGQANLFPQRIEQRCPRIGIQPVFLAIGEEGEPQSGGPSAACPPEQRRTLASGSGRLSLIQRLFQPALDNWFAAPL